MKKILIISDGSVGEHFIQRVIDAYTSENIYYVVQTKAKEFPTANPARFKFYEFDPTSFYKLSNLLKMDFIQVLIAMDSKQDVENTVKNIRAVKKRLRVIVLDKWDTFGDDFDATTINSNEILSSKLLDYLPNVPVIAQNVGMGEGEIMEVLVPFGSSFVYRHLGSIEQNSWRIVAIYRDRKLVLPSRYRMIQPNDLLVLVGEPSVLKSVYKVIKRELGHFPEPFGSNLYLCIDMEVVNLETLHELVQKAVFAHKIFKHNLIIKILNPNDIEMVEYIKDFRRDDIIIDIDYEYGDYENTFFQDIKSYHVGLIITSTEMFRDYGIRNKLYESHVPILKIADKPFESISDTSIILSNNRDLEKVSTTIFDISEQMNFNIELYNYLNEHQEDKKQVIEHYKNLATIFTKSIKVIETEDNPLRVLKKKENFMHIVPFTNKLTKRKLLSTFSMDSERLFHKLDDYHQIFIPVQL